MRVSDSRRVLFVHVQKTGGSTIDAMWDDEVPDARKGKGLLRHAPYAKIVKAEPELEDYWSFGFVRNPWARMVSWWSMAVDFERRLERGKEETTRKWEKQRRIWAPLVEYNDTFEKFVLEGPEGHPRLGRPQINMLTAKGGGIGVDFIGRTENLVADMNVARERLGLEPVAELPRRNKSKHRHYSTYYTDETRERVAELYAPDIEEFGYTFEQR
ncbi:sulfotransferase family 2 domain-containing protein [Nocardioides sp. CN2-186]|uniref:sulfotransferase family 2 domain-containing protein n=1 Tax=Nocardioides tweenelious TaxID=3156607 RepID=UPI0032B53CCD